MITDHVREAGSMSGETVVGKISGQISTSTTMLNTEGFSPIAAGSGTNKTSYERAAMHLCG